MKQVLKFIVCVLIAYLLISSCKKDSPANSFTPPNPVNPTVPANKLPVANAGPDISVNYDLQTCKQTDTIILNGSASFDPDGMIVSYFWRGPGLAGFAASPILKFDNLPPGTHKYALSVTDDKGAYGTDTVTVSVLSLMNRAVIDATLLPFGILSQPRAGVVTASAGNKILFAGGYNYYSGGTSTRVDIYDMNTSSWSTAELSQARYGIAVAVLGTKIFFAGGAEGGWWDGISTHSRVDIYDASTNTWSVANLSEARGFIAAASVGNKVFFAGGVTNNYLSSPTIDIYDVVNGSWSTASLSIGRNWLSAETANNKIYFAGGSYGGPMFHPSAVIDIYDNNTGSWTVSTMSEPKTNFQSIAVGNKIFWAGGSGNVLFSNNVEIRDGNSQSSTLTCLFQPLYADHGYQKAVSVNNKILFLPGNIQDQFDIYDLTSNMWFIGNLNKHLYEAAVISVNNTIYIAAGYVNGSLSNQVWKLEY